MNVEYFMVDSDERVICSTYLEHVPFRPVIKDYVIGVSVEFDKFDHEPQIFKIVLDHLNDTIMAYCK